MLVVYFRKTSLNVNKHKNNFSEITKKYEYFAMAPQEQKLNYIKIQN